MKDLGKKKLLIIAGGIVGLLILIIIILLIYNSLFVKTSYKDIENKVVEAAKKYYSENESLLPTNENEEVQTTDANLTASGHLKSMNKLTKKLGSTCTATVIVSYAGGNYRYTPLLDCGDKYSTKTIVSHIQNSVSRVTSGEGLYELNGELVYRGEEPNNYVKFSDKLWRIVKITDNKLVIILDEKSVKSVWDDRFNSDRNRTDGINDYKVSRIYEKLLEMYNGDTIFNDNTRGLLSSHNLYIGSRLDTDFYNDGSIEKAVLFEKQYIGLLPLYDYINASLDTNCNSAVTDSCINYNYLNQYGFNWWTLTSDQANTHKVYRITLDGSIGSIRASASSYVRPVIYLAKDALYTGGTGTSEDPYTIK